MNDLHQSASPDAKAPSNEELRRVARQLAQLLGESRKPPQDLIFRLLRAHGTDFVFSHYKKASDIQAQGGMFLEHEGRRRTFGGVFFHLVRTTLGPEEWAKMRGYSPREGAGKGRPSRSPAGAEPGASASSSPATSAAGSAGEAGIQAGDADEGNDPDAEESSGDPESEGMGSEK